MKITISNKLVLQDVPSQIEGVLRDRLTFINPKYIENERFGYWNGRTSQYLFFYERIPGGGLFIPRGFARQIVDFCRHQGVSFSIDDQCRTLPEIDFDFKGQLRPYQQAAVEEVLKHDFGTMEAPTSSGKTIMALAAIAQRRQPALIVVHTKELLNQWIDRIGTFLGIPPEEIGVMGNGRRTIGQKISVGLVQSLYKCAPEIAPHIGFLIVDECHRTPSRTFSEAVSAFDSKYMLGLSATPFRRDGLSKLIFLYLGDVVHKIKTMDLQRSGDILKADVVWRETDFQTSLDASTQYPKVLSRLTRDQDRNCMIVQDVAQVAGNGGGICLVLSDRKEHVEKLHSMIEDIHHIPAECLHGDLPKRDRERVVDRLNSGKVRVLVATGQLIGERALTAKSCPPSSLRHRSNSMAASFSI